MRSMSTELWLNALGISMDSRKVAGQKFVINLVTPDNNETFALELSNSALTNIKGQLATKPDLTITVNRSDLERVMGGTATFDQLISEGKAKFDGDRKPFETLRGALVSFTPDFEVLPGTKKGPSSVPAIKDPIQAPEPADTSGG